MQTDQQLAEIYQNVTSAAHVGQAVFKWNELSQDHQDARIEGIRAVREAVEKEQAEDSTWKAAALLWESRFIEKRNEFTKQAEEIARLSAIIEQAIEMVNTPGTTKDNLPIAINAKIVQRDEFHDATLKKLDAAKEDVKRLLKLDATNRENCDGTHKALVESQLLQLATQKELASLQKNYEVERNCSGERMTQILNLQREVEKANAELERLRWQPIATAPKDGQWILTWRAVGAGGEPEVKQARWYPDRNSFGGHGWTFPMWESSMPSHWRPFFPPPAPSAEEVRRKKFDTWYDERCKDPSQHKTALREAMFDSWQAALAAIPPVSSFLLPPS